MNPPDQPETLLTGPMLVALDDACHNYPTDCLGQQEHFARLPGHHTAFEEHLRTTYTDRQLAILRDALDHIL